MLTSRYDFLDRWIITSLQPINQRGDIRLQMKRVFTWRFLATTPSWIPARLTVNIELCHMLAKSLNREGWIEFCNNSKSQDMMEPQRIENTKEGIHASTHLYGLILGVQKSRPVRLTLLNARASVLTTVATACMSASSKAAPIVMGCGNDVACEKSPEALKFTPGLLATPCNASSAQHLVMFKRESAIAE